MLTHSRLLVLLEALEDVLNAHCDNEKQNVIADTQKRICHRIPPF